MRPLLKKSFTLFLICMLLSACSVLQDKSKGFDPGAQQISSIDGMVLLYVPAGKFEMGYVDGKKDEGPVHTVFLDAFWIDQTEVTNAMYRKCEQAGICEKPTQATYAFKRTNSATRDDYYVNPEYDNYPALYINWSQASDYCEWAGRRLPTEAEWEKAARGTDGRLYPWGNELPNENLANFGGYIGDTTEVGSYLLGASPYGALDMAGNVWEWVSDWYNPDFYSNSPRRNPTGPDRGYFHIERGGSWRPSEKPIRSSYRGWYTPPFLGSVVVAHNYDGFRCVFSE